MENTINKKPSALKLAADRISAILEGRKRTRLKAMTYGEITKLLGNLNKSVSVKQVVTSEKWGTKGEYIATGHIALQEFGESVTIPVDGTDIEFAPDFSGRKPKPKTPIVVEQTAAAIDAAPEAAITAEPTKEEIVAETTNEGGADAAEAATEKHICTQEDLDNNPELAENEVKVGDEIYMPKQEETE